MVSSKDFFILLFIVSFSDLRLAIGPFDFLFDSFSEL